MAKDDNNYISESSIDDLLRSVLEPLIRNVDAITATKGKFTELFGVLLELTNPRARLSRSDAKGTIFSCLGEFLWYMTGKNELDFIKYYLPIYNKFSDDGVKVYGGYGPRLLSKLSNDQTQLENIINILKEKHTSRQAVIQLFGCEDLTKGRKDIPCTCTLQFVIRYDRLQMLTNMRSNDAFKGLPHDIFAFTMIQELVARSLGLDIGVYKHMVGSLHLYDCDRAKAKMFLDEGWTSNITMPMMPVGEPWPSIDLVLSAEAKIKNGISVDLSKLELDDYWLDILRLLEIFKLSKSNNLSEIRNIENDMAVDIYKPYISKRYDLI